jgi:NAD(P)-dependent dehydrogenase (short-subunit alcohol dehydrogenase family)
VQLAGKRIVVLGGARGMGEAAVKAFGREGAGVAVLDLDRERAGRVAAAAADLGPGHVEARRADVSDRHDLARAFEWATGWLGGLDALVNAAGIQRDAPAESTGDDAWDVQFAVNARGTFLSNQLAFPYLQELGGRIVNFASGAGVTGMPGAAAYAATKGAVLAWTRTIALEWGRYGIIANAVVPAIRTDMADEHRARLDPDQQVELDERHAREIPLGGRLGDPELDFAPVAVFLVSDASRFITGQTICVNGGKLLVT